LKELFHIKNASIPVQPVLLLQAGENYLAFAVAGKGTEAVQELAYCIFEDMDSSALADFLSNYPLLKEQYYDIQVMFDSDSSHFIPSAGYNAGEAESFLKTLSGVNEGCRIVSEFIPEWQLYNCYAVDNVLWEWVNLIFPFAKYRHSFTLMLKNAGAASAAGCILVDFGTGSFSVLATAGNKLLVTNSAAYSTPEDVLFVLLKICNQNNLSQANVSLKLSGLIDRDSALYKELYQYFINIEFREAGWNTGSHEYPPHFFTSLNDLAQCVS
jgi:hypothetical protein